MANLRTNNLSGEQGQNAYRGAVFFEGARSFLYMGEDTLIGSATGFGTNDFTIEFWINQGVNDSNYTIIFTLHTTTAKGFEVAFHSGTIQIYTDTGSWRDTGYAPKAGVYEHIAFVRNYSGNTLKMYVNGEEKYSVSNSVDYSDNFDYVQIGSYDVSSYGYLEGYLSNFRILNGTALYTTNYFTPPTSELKAIPDTILLCCQDSNDPTQEATGKTITAVGGRFQTGNNNILKNGDFSQGTDGFSGDSGASISESGGVMTVTNGGGDNLYALKQERCLRIGGKYRCTATITPTFASGNPVFRVRFGGDAVSFTQPQATMSTGVAVRIDTGEKVADGENFEIGSGDSSGITQFTVTDLVVTAIDPPIPVKNIPPFGVDAGNTFGGTIQQSSQGYMYFPTGRTEEKGRGRVVIAGGTGNSPYTPYMTRIDFFNITTTGNTLLFGDLSFGSRSPKGMVSSTTRAVYAGGMGPSSEVATNSMSYITIATQGNGIDYGDLTAAGRQSEGCSNDTRGIYFSGQNDSPSPGTNNNIIDFITTASTGNATDFGDQTNGRDGGGACQSTTRGIYAGGDPSPYVNILDFITIATAGNAQDFGDLSFARTGSTGCSNSVRGLFMSGRVAPTNYNTIEFITIATTGNSEDFGDLSYVRIQASAAANKTRGVLIGGNPGSSPYNFTEMSQVTIASTGNATNFGDCFAARTRGSVSDSHGGLS
jgi:hypothetical protein